VIFRLGWVSFDGFIVFSDSPGEIPGLEKISGFIIVLNCQFRLDVSELSLFFLKLFNPFELFLHFVHLVFKQ